MDSLYRGQVGLPPRDLVSYDELDFSRPRSEWTQAEVSSGIWHLQNQDSGTSTKDESSVGVSEKAFAYMDSLYRIREGLPPKDLIPYDELDFSRRDKWSQEEVSSGIWHLKNQDTSIPSEGEETVGASDKSFAYLDSLYRIREGLPPKDLIPYDELDFSRRDEWSQEEVSSGIWHLKERKVDSESRRMSDAAFSYLQSLAPDVFGEPQRDVMPIEDVDIEAAQERGYFTPDEGSALIDYYKAVEKSQPPPRASEAMERSLRRMLPEAFMGIPEDEKPLIPIPELAAQMHKQGYLTPEVAREMFRHVPESPPPMATPRQVARLEMEHAHAFKRLGSVEQYLESGQSYGIVRSLEDIYDADTFTGMLFDAPSGQVFKEDTVRLGDFNAPEIQPDRTKPKEYQEREATRAREARDVFRSLVQRYNIGRDVEKEGYVIPIQFRHDSSMLGGLERGYFGRVLGDVNFEGVDYEQFMIQQRMGSVYGADVEWGAEEIDPLALWRRSPTYLDQLGDDTTRLLETIPQAIVGDVIGGVNPGDAVTDTLRQVPGALKNIAVNRAKQTAGRVVTDFIKERISGEFTPNKLSFVERYLGDFSGIGEKAGSFFESGLGAALAPVALAAGTAIIGERSLDQNYAEVISTQQEKVRNFDSGVERRQEMLDRAMTGSGGDTFSMMKRALREVLSESGLGSLDEMSTALDRSLRESDRRGITRPRSR